MKLDSPLIHHSSLSTYVSVAQFTSGKTIIWSCLSDIYDTRNIHNGGTHLTINSMTLTSLHHENSIPLTMTRQCIYLIADEEAVQVRLGPTHGNLKHGLEIGQAQTAKNEQPTPQQAAHDS